MKWNVLINSCGEQDSPETFITTQVTTLWPTELKLLDSLTSACFTVNGLLTLIFEVQPQYPFNYIVQNVSLIIFFFEWVKLILKPETPETNIRVNIQLNVW